MVDSLFLSPPTEATGSTGRQAKRQEEEDYRDRALRGDARWLVARRVALLVSQLWRRGVVSCRWVLSLEH